MFRRSRTRGYNWLKQALDRPGRRWLLTLLMKVHTWGKLHVWADPRTLKQLRMERSLDDLPPLAVPGGYEVRTYRPGDEPSWVALVDGPIGQWDEATAQRDFFADPTVPDDGVLFVVRGSEYVATATARRRPEDGPETGYVAMVVVAPQHRGHGIGYLASLAVLHRLREWGLQRAILETDDSREAAVRTYLRLGFAPLPLTDDHPRRWEAVFSRLKAS